MRSAVNSGYALGFKTILDANILTMLTALVLFIFATAQPKGFAVTLILGVLVSMFTAVLFTRAMLGVLAGFAFFNRPSLMGVKAGQIEHRDGRHGRHARRRFARRRGAAAQPAPTARRPGRRGAPTARRRPPPAAGQRPPAAPHVHLAASARSGDSR